jgi:response regulator RpfG family c-di-GMP phosphodiesterase/putative methionine-R-sulfoxide reductase with GAF domain
MNTPLRVLLVEDVEDDALLLVRHLQQGGFDPSFERVDTAETVEAALRKQGWDIVIADYSLPRFSGLLALDMVKANGQDVPFILVSGVVGEYTAVEAMRAGANDYLMKNNLARLAEVVRRELDEAENRRGVRLAEKALRRRDAITEAVRFAGETHFVRNTAWEQGVPEVLARLGQAAGVSRAYVFENHPASDGELPTSLRFEWVAAGIEAQLDNPDMQAFPLREGGFGRWVETLSGGKAIYGLVKDFPPSEQPVLRARGIRSLAVVPISAGGTLWGFLGLDDHWDERGWVPSELDALQSAADILGASIQWTRAENRVRDEAARALGLARVTSRLNARLDPEKVLATVCEETILALEVPFATVYLYDDERQLLYPAALAGAPSEELHRLQSFPRAQYEEFAEKSGRALVIPDVQALPSKQALVLDPSGAARTLAFVSMLGLGELVGALAVVTVGEVRVFTQDDLTLLQEVADQAAQAIINARLYEQSRRRLRHSQALRNISLAITAVLDLHLTLVILLEQAISQLGVDAVDVLLLKREEQVLEYAVGKGFGTGALMHTRLRVGEGQAGLAALERRIVSIPDLRSSDALKASPMLPQERFVAYFAVPLIAKGEVKGVLEVFHRAPLHPDREWLEFMEALGGQAAIAIDNATLFDSLQRTHVDLVLAYDSTIEGWSRALDLRDKETEGHTQRVTEMTQQLARGMGMSEIELVHVRRGALLHDIGKMGIPDNILLKPGPLTAEEWEVMRRHPAYAHELLSPIAYLLPAIDIPYCHHEKWDGSGYPQGLKGDQVPLSARLFAVVDVWDALRSDRPYRPAWPEERVLDHIRSESGKHFEPKAVGAFIETVRAGASPDRTPGSSP